MIENTPIWVWVLLVVLLLVGFRAVKKHTTSIKTIVLIPLVLTLWSLSKLQSFDLYFFIAAFVGLGFSFLLLARKPINVEKEKMQITFHGTFVVLFVVLSIFSTKYFFGCMHAINEPFFETFGWLENLLTGLIIGILWGKSIKELLYFSNWKA